MKAKILIGIPISDNETLAKNTEVKIVDGHCGTDGYYYTCKVFNDRQIIIKSDLLEITDYTPYIDWEQRRYEIAKAIAASIWTHSYIKLNVAKVAIEQADALIAELKKK